MIDQEMIGRVPLNTLVPRTEQRWAADCPCGWQGRARQTSLAALNDHDRHLATREHQRQLEASQAKRRDDAPTFDPESVLLPDEVEPMEA